MNKMYVLKSLTGSYEDVYNKSIICSLDKKVIEDRIEKIEEVFKFIEERIEKSKLEYKEELKPKFMNVLRKKYDFLAKISWPEYDSAPSLSIEEIDIVE